MLPFHNARIKRYPDGSAEILVGSRPFGGGTVQALPSFADDGEPPFRWPSPGELGLVEADLEERRYVAMERDAIELDDDVYSLEVNAAACRAASVRRSVRRARKAVRDLARSNDWAYFVTLTLDQERCNRYDPDEVLRHLRHWLGNNVRRKGLAYVLVPEHHKDGAIHFHGLFNDALDAVDSGTMSVPGRKAPVRVRSEEHRRALEAQGGHTVYNLPGWGWGFSTAIQLYGERDAAINYVCKYIGKEMLGKDGADFGTPAKIGGRWYYSGGALERPTVEWFDVDIRDYENIPGWYTPEAYPFASFLTLRVTAEGEVLPPYISETGTNVSRETSPDAKRGRGVDQPEKLPQRGSFEGGQIRPGPSSGSADAGADEMPLRLVAPGSYPPEASLCMPPRPAHNVAKKSHLTKSGLFTQPPATAPQPPGEGRGKNDQLNLFILEV